MPGEPTSVIKFTYGLPGTSLCQERPVNMS